eukprot:932914-Pyramimonas_sp.AAC.1
MLDRRNERLCCFGRAQIAKSVISLVAGLGCAPVQGGCEWFHACICGGPALERIVPLLGPVALFLGFSSWLSR